MFSTRNFVAAEKGDVSFRRIPIGFYLQQKVRCFVSNLDGEVTPKHVFIRLFQKRCVMMRDVCSF